jgi:hypothetical protein
MVHVRHLSENLVVIATTVALSWSCSFAVGKLQMQRSPRWLVHDHFLLPGFPFHFPRHSEPAGRLNFRVLNATGTDLKFRISAIDFNFEKSVEHGHELQLLFPILPRDFSYHAEPVCGNGGIWQQKVAAQADYYAEIISPKNSFLVTLRNFSGADVSKVRVNGVVCPTSIAADGKVHGIGLFEVGHSLDVRVFRGPQAKEYFDIQIKTEYVHGRKIVSLSLR